MDEDTLYRIICPDCRLELHWDNVAFVEWIRGPRKCPQCGAALRDVMADEVPLSSKPDFKPEVGQSLRWSFAMQVGRTFSLRTDDVMRLLEMLKNYDKERGEELRKLGEMGPNTSEKSECVSAREPVE